MLGLHWIPALQHALAWCTVSADTDRSRGPFPRSLDKDKGRASGRGMNRLRLVAGYPPVGWYPSPTPLQLISWPWWPSSAPAYPRASENGILLLLKILRPLVTRRELPPEAPAMISLRLHVACSGSSSSLGLISLLCEMRRPSWVLHRVFF